ncbi:MAG TPA: agmatine deiminase family protein [Phycisphaerales bacterium]|nr:agmatine deiminase family protein [Phycisphaerales bacterium]
MARVSFGRVLGVVGLVAASCFGQEADGPRSVPHDQPILVDGHLVFPDGAEIPRFLTEAERRYLATNPLVPERGTRGAPVGDIYCVPEYDPMEAILISWEGSSAQKSILAEMAKHITTTGDADLHVAIDTSGAIPAAQATLSGAGADMSRVKFFVRTMDSIWIRDYGPRYVYRNGVRAVIDHTYNRPRPNDNAFNGFYAGQRGHDYFLIPLVHGGGNYHLSALGDAYATKLIENENPLLTKSQIVGHWQDYQNVLTEITPAFPTNIDSTQHIDMWMIVIGDREVIISDWPLASGSTQDVICDNQAASMAAAGYTVHRIPAVTSGGVHYTFTNSVICNDLVLVPTYTNATASQYNAPALAVWQAAMPDKTVVQVNCQGIVGLAGVMHCIVMHVPVSLGGENPVATIDEPNGGEGYAKGEQATVRWASDDNDLTYYVQIHLSTDGGQTFNTVLTTFHPDTGEFNWTVPQVDTAKARIRVIVHDFDGNTGQAISEADFTIGDPSCPADFNGDTVVNTLDVLAFLNAYSSGDPSADFNGDTIINTLDVLAFLNAFVDGCP